MAVNKKAVMWEVIIPLIIIIVTAAILVFFLVLVPYKSMVGKEACHQSIVLRNNAILGGTELTPGMIPLNCKTNPLVIDTSDEMQIKRDIANEMYDCWWTYGEGKMDFFSKTSWWDIKNPLGIEKVSCTICSTIHFEKSAKDKKIDITDYLQDTKIPKKEITYLSYFNDKEGTKLAPEQRIEVIDTNKDYAILIVGTRGGKIKTVLTTVGMSAASGAAIGAAFLGVGAIPGAIIGAIVGVFSGSTVMGTSFALNSYFSSIRCDSSTSGCFILTLTELNAGNISRICQNIENIP